MTKISTFYDGHNHISKGMTPVVNTKIDLWCQCGNSMTASVSPAVAANKIHEIFLAVHRGDGHLVTDKSTRPDGGASLPRRGSEIGKATHIVIGGESETPERN